MTKERRLEKIKKGIQKYEVANKSQRNKIIIDKI